MEFGWYFNDEYSPSDELVDKYADSKFSIDKWTSFTREIIQNSLDARDDENEPVEVVFDLNKELRLQDIPGGEYTRDVLMRCIEKASNKQTKMAYKKGLEILDKPFVYCMKVSDYNTKGVCTGRDNAWGAFVFDEGKSVKQRPGSAGSHGVGKKVPFIISTCNTVFYATKNKYKKNGLDVSDILIQGKTTLINWNDDAGVRKSSKGWYGRIDQNAPSQKNKVLPLINSETRMVNDYFVRNDLYGTDVIMIGVNAYDNESQIKSAIISSIFENFFVAIKEGTLKVNVFGEEFASRDLSKFFMWYKPTDTLHNSMNDLIRVYSDEADILPIIVNGEKKGEVELYFDDSSELNRKYYTIVRDHGMKIKEYRINRADKPFSAIAITKGPLLNELLSKLENAAHNDFIIYDEDMDLDKDAVKTFKELKSTIESYIVERTTINDGENQKIDGLYDILAIPGFTPNITKKDSKTRIRKNKVNKRKKRKQEPKPGPVPPEPKPEPNPDPAPKQKKKEKPLKEYNSFEMEPVLVKNQDGYLLRVMVKHDIKDCEIYIKSINSDEKIDNSIADKLVSASDGWKKYKIQDGCIKKVKLNKNQLYEIQIKTKRDIRYRLTAELWYREA